VIRGRFVLRATIDWDRGMENPWDIATESTGRGNAKLYGKHMPIVADHRYSVLKQ
jgi:hypothetical protein